MLINKRDNKQHKGNTGRVYCSFILPGALAASDDLPAAEKIHFFLISAATDTIVRRGDEFWHCWEVRTAWRTTER